MNGSLALFLLSLLAQSAISPLGANLQGSQGNDSTSELTQYGWQINDENELEYLIQLSPDMLPFMTDTKNQNEFTSKIPKELIGRIQRVVVSIGTQVLPRRPSLEEIQRMVPSIASLPGRMRELEPGTQVNNVINNQYPEPPANFGSNSGFVGNHTASVPPVPSTPLGGTFLNQARAGNQPSNSNPSRPSLPANNQIGSLPSAPQSGRFSDTASSQTSAPRQTNTNAGFPQTGTTGVANSGWNASSNSAPMTSDTFDRERFAGNLPGGSPPWPPVSQDPASLGYNQTGQGYNNFGNNYAGPGSLANPPLPASNQMYSQPQPAYPHQHRYDPQYGHGQNGYSNAYAGQTGYAGQNSQNQIYDRQAPSFPSYSGGFGDMPGIPGQSIADRTRGSDRWANPIPSTVPLGRPGESLVASRDRDYLDLNDNRPSVRDTSGSAVHGRNSGQRNTDIVDSRQTTSTNESSNYHLFVFFVLSVAVNLWMVHLLRSLYTRYRTLLTSLRGQTA